MIPVVSPEDPIIPGWGSLYGAQRKPAGAGDQFRARVGGKRPDTHTAYADRMLIKDSTHIR